MKLFSRVFLKGLAFIVPAAGTIAILVWAIGALESLALKVFEPLLPSQLQVPGIGILLAILLVFAIGLLAHLWIFNTLMGYLEALLARAPLVKAIYGSLKDFANFVWPSDPARRKLGKPLRVHLEKLGLHAIGFEMVDDLGNHVLSRELEGKEDKIVVYFPMSYQIGGYMAIVDRKDAAPLDLSSEEALRLALTAGVTGKATKAAPEL